RALTREDERGMTARLIGRPQEDEDHGVSGVGAALDLLARSQLQRLYGQLRVRHRRLGSLDADPHRPRYAFLKSSFCSKSAATPSRTIRPVERTYPRSAIDSDTFAFCSTTSMATPASCTCLMISKFRSTSTGASPIDGSSISSSLGRDISARPI